MTTPPKRGGRRVLTIVIVLVIALLACAGIVWVVAGPAITNLFNALAVPLSTSNDFMTAVQAKNYTTAYGMIISSQQTSFGGSADGMQQLFEGNGWEPTDYKSTNVATYTSGQTLVNGTGTFGGTTKYVSIVLQKEGDTWKIAGFSASTTPPTPEATSSS